MYQKDSEMLFPARVIPAMGKLRGEKWHQFVAQIAPHPENHPDVLAFSLMMIRLAGCVTCKADSYRAMRGCTLCATQTIVRYKGTDDDLIAEWRAARDDLITWLQQPATVAAK
ncbi:MAG: hypothetical protein GYB65_00580 [Chloroflexi bacterium]|nr:hypothetical protein [Chloroflexota bacterium]